MQLRKYDLPSSGRNASAFSNPKRWWYVLLFSHHVFCFHPPLVIDLAMDFLSSSLPMVFVRRRQAESDLQMRAWLAEGAAAEGSRRRPQDEKSTIKTD